MPGKRVSMRKIREVLRLKWGLGIEEREIASSCKISRSTLWEYLRRAKDAGLSWPLPADLSDEALEAHLFQGDIHRGEVRPEPDWETIHKEYKRHKGVTLLLLWREYIAQHPDGYGYVTFTMKYREWRKPLDVTLRQDHKAGEKLFVDYAGITISITDSTTGELRQAQVFVATLGASNYSYAEVTASQSLEDWLGSHRRTLEFFGGVPRAIIPDNLKSGVKSPCYYEPELNVAYAEFAQHYGVAILPARVGKPRDKAKVENGVQNVERNLLAPLRHRTFFSVQEANEAVQDLLTAFNDKPFQKLLGSRRSVFEELDKPALQPLPAQAFELARWKKAKVHIDYHLEVDGHYYSVPYRYVGQAVEMRLTQSVIEIFQNNQRIASHRRLPELPVYRGKHTTLAEHMPEKHKYQGDWSEERFIAWAQKIGEHTAKVITEILASRRYPEQGFRSCLGVLRLADRHSEERLEAACQRACHFRTFSFKSIQSILQTNLDAEPLPGKTEKVATPPQLHQNVRGASYYAQSSKPS